MLSQAEAGKFFNKAFTNGSQEAATGCMELPEDVPTDFQYFVKWLYEIWMELEKVSICWAKLEVMQQFRLYAFAHKYAINILQDAIICDLHDFENTNEWRSTKIRREDLEFLVANVPDGSPLLRFLADWLINDEFNVLKPGVRIDEEVLEKIPAAFMRFVLRHLLEHKICAEFESFLMSDKEAYMLPKDMLARDDSEF